MDTRFFHNCLNCITYFAFIFFLLCTAGCRGITPSTILTNTEPADGEVTDNALELTEMMSPGRCAGLCWGDIKVGKTGYSEALTILEQMEVEVEANKPHHIAWRERKGSIVQSGDLAFREDVVESIYLWLNKERRIIVDDLVQVIGEPEWVLVAKAFSSEHQCAGASLFYSTVGIEASLVQEDTFIGVERSQAVYSIIFLSPHQLERWQERTDSELLRWNGYQDYCPDPSE